MLKASIKQFRYYKQLAAKAMPQIPPQSIFHRFHAEDNSIAVIVSHMAGNMKSRWTNIFTEDGEKPWRNRDGEFEESTLSHEEILKTWEEGWKLLFDTLSGLRKKDLKTVIYIRNEGLTIEDAIIRQLCHYSYHCGQIVYKCKQLSAGNWQSLSIPRRGSKEYNQSKFDQVKEKRDYLQSLLDQGS